MASKDPSKGTAPDPKEHSFFAATARARQEMEETLKTARKQSEQRTRELLKRLSTTDYQAQARERFAESLARIRNMMGKPREAGVGPNRLDTVSIPALHAIERLLSQVRHSVVRVCFYNLKLFAPSLVDAYDATVREQIAKNIAQLPQVEAELDRFFAEEPEPGTRIGSLFPQNQRLVTEQVRRMATLVQSAQDRLDDVDIRKRLAAGIPACIDEIMGALQSLQKDLDSRKVSVEDLAEQAAVLARPLCEEAGLVLTVRRQVAPRVFANARALLNCLVELIVNAAAHSGGTEVSVSTGPETDRGAWAVVTVADNGHGMTPDQLNACVFRGVSESGGGEGLPMAVAVVEEEHLGRFELTSETGKGCQATVRLPVKWERPVASKLETGN